MRIASGGALIAGCGSLGVGCGRSWTEGFSVEPGRVRGDEPFVVRLRDLPPGQRVLLSATFDDARGQEWTSTAVFEADDGGRVDTSEQSPVDGYYGVRDPMGLVWSALGSVPYESTLRGSVLRVRARAGGEEAEARVERFDLAEDARSVEVREDGLVGRLFSPARRGPVPGILVLGGSEGGLAPYLEREAALLASRGYAAFALAYFRGEFFAPEGVGSLPDTLTNVPLEYFGRALGWLGGRGGVRGDRLGVIGHSRGGELALLLGATQPEVKAVVSYVGSGVVVSSPEGDEPAWTRAGEPVPYVAFTGGEAQELSSGEISRTEIPVEKTNGPVLLISAGDDALWPSERLSRVAYERLSNSRRTHEDETVTYPGAGHAIVAPYAPTTGNEALGGTPEADAAAAEDAWRRTLALLDRSLRG